jgi:hypothetical protein
MHKTPNGWRNAEESANAAAACMLVVWHETCGMRV